MNKYEHLMDEADRTGIEVIDYTFSSRRIKGLYCDGSIAINKNLNTLEKSCILAEELGHYYTSSGDILNQGNISNCKQEHKARVFAYNNTVGLYGIVSAIKSKCFSLLDMADFLEVTEDFLLEALTYYKSKYGKYVKLDNYMIFFEPLGVLELYK